MLPIAMVLLMINVTVGIISRSAPTLNLFSFGFPITLISVFILLYVSVGAFGASSQDLIESGLSYIQTMIGDLANG
jgi:flagellar biosynthetic protein FliR